VGFLVVLIPMATGYPIIGILLALLFLAIIIYLIWSRDRKDERHARREALFYPRKSEAAKAIYDAAERGTIWDANSAMQDMARTVQRLAKLGHVGQTIRYHWSTQMHPLHPIADSFEPKILDESAPSFLEFCSAVSDQDPGSAGDASSTWKVFKRNATANGRW